MNKLLYLVIWGAGFAQANGPILAHGFASKPSFIEIIVQLESF